MSRFSHYDTDDERLPEGMRRVGYDADTQVYTFQDADGSYWEGSPGCEYGQVTRVGDTAAAPLLEADSEAHQPATSWRHDMMPLLNFGLLIGLCLLLLFWYLHGSSASTGQLQEPPQAVAASCGAGAAPYTVRAGDTCWAIGEDKGIGVDGVLARNRGLDCDGLVVGARICLPE